MKYHTFLSFFFKFSTPSSKATSINHCLWPLQPHFTTPEGGKRPILFPQEIKKIKVNFLLNFPSKVSRRSNHLLTNPPTTFLLMLTRDLNKPLFDTPNASSYTEFSGQSNLQKMFLIKSTKKCVLPRKCHKQPLLFPKVSCCEERESNLFFGLLAYLTNTYWVLTFRQIPCQPWR